MPHFTQLPTISGKKLIRLLQKAGWIVQRRAKHGVALTKRFTDRTRVTIVPDTNTPLDDGTLSAILGYKQTGIGKKGLLDLVNKFGI
jgi:predicted RNA binding protein YcfA (HicA-like mRNA interferase family)